MSAQVGEKARDARILLLIFRLWIENEELPLVDLERLKVNCTCPYVQLTGMAQKIELDIPIE